LFSQLQGAPLQQISQKLGLDAGTASAAIAAALPLLIGTLGRNASQPQGAASLFGALQDHRGQDIGGLVGNVLGGGGQGSQILGHMFGTRQDLAAQGLGSATGLAPDKAHVLLRWLAPIAMAYIAKRMYDRRQGHAAGAGGHGSIVAAENQAAQNPATPPTPGDLGEVLGKETRQIEQQGGLGGGLLGAVLDRNHDGKVDFSDLAGMAGNLGGLGGLGSILQGGAGGANRNT
jgi:hypothetical protein